MPQNTGRGYTYPVYTDVVDFPAQIQELATDIDTDIEALFNRLTAGYNPAACRVRSSGINQSIANNTDVAATFAEELYDNASMVDLGVSNTTINITQTGTYLACVRATFANSSGSDAACQISLVSSGALGTVGRRSVALDASVPSSATSSPVSFIVAFWAASGTTLQLIQRQNSGGALNTSTRTMMVARTGTL